MRSFIYWVLIPVLVILLIGCNGRGDDKLSSSEPRAKSGNVYAEKFSITSYNGYTSLTIRDPWQGAKNVEQVFYLVKRGEKVPDRVDPGMVIQVPLHNVVCMSTTWLAMISALGKEGSIKGISGTSLVYSEKIRQKIADGSISEVGYEDNINKELIVTISPDIIFTYGVGSESAGYVGKIREMGYRILYIADYLENDPLAKAEWIKVFGALFSMESLSDSLFRSIEREYLDLKSYLSSVISYRPKVLLGLPWKDTWYISPGNSFMSKLVLDAGGDYLWADTESDVSMPYGIESVYSRALNADFWLNSGSARTRKEIIGMDKRLGDLPPYKTGNIFNNNRRMSPNGGNDYWESGSVLPQVILRDIASILHPELFEDHELFFYRKVDK